MLGHTFVCSMQKHGDMHSQVVCIGDHAQGKTCVSMTSKCFAVCVMNSSVISPSNDMNFHFLCRKMTILEAIFSGNRHKVFEFSMAGVASNATGNHSQVCIEGLLEKLQ